LICITLDLKLFALISSLCISELLKGQLNLKCLFVASWGLPGSFSGQSGIKKHAGTPLKLPGSPKEAIKTFRAEILIVFILSSFLNPHFEDTLAPPAPPATPISIAPTVDR
jgi:hypothetical protein